MRLHMPAARRSGLGFMVAGFIAGIVLTMSILSVMRDGRSEPVLRQLGTDDAHLLHHDHRHSHRHSHSHAGGDDDSKDVKVVDLSEEDKHKHRGQSADCLA